MNLGVSSYTWPWAVGIKGYMPEKLLDAIGLLEKARNLDVKVLQIADNITLQEISDEGLKKIYTKAQQYSITLEVGTRGIEPEHLLNYLEIAKKLGSKIVRTITPIINNEAVSLVKQVLPKYEDAGVSITFENHGEHKTRKLADFINRINSKNVGICLDTVNSFASLEPPEQVLRELAPYVLNFHVKDYDIVRIDYQLGLLIEGRPAGEGRLDVEWIAEYLRRKEKDPNAILELWTPFSTTVQETIQRENEWAVKSIKYLKNIIR